MPTPESNFTGKDRRRRLRFPLTTELRYEVIGKRRAAAIKGTGRVQDISSDGLAFRADGPLEPDMWLLVSMAWPAKLDNETMLRLVFEGTVRRTSGDLVVVTIERPEFRATGKSTAGAREEIGALAQAMGIGRP